MVKRWATSGNRPVAVDFFCGAGGMSLGFEQAGFDVALGVDVDGHHVAAHARNFPGSVALCRSIVGLSAGDVYEALGGKLELDLVFGGPPCQGFSNMGLRDTADPRNTLVDEFARLVAELQPKAFVMENVPGMLAGETRSVLGRTVTYLKRRGYRITEPVRLLDASNFGVPQKRKRLFLIGVRRDLEGIVSYPIGPCLGQPPRPTVIEAIGDLPDVDRYEELFALDAVAYDQEPETAYAKVARGKSLDPSDFSYPRSWEDDRCTGCLRIRHTAKAVAIYAATTPGRTVPGHKLPRLDGNGICPTLRAGSDSTHGSYTAPRPIHPARPRCITAREAARLHGFPDWFWCYPLKWHAYRQIGNSVCPPVARAIGTEILRVLDRKPLKPPRALVLSDEFILPNDRPRSLKRIPHRVNYPPVITYLFDKAYDEKSQRLYRKRFTFDDVEEAIAATGVNLAWTRSDTFVQEIARSRNRLQILAPCLAKGYTLRAVKDGRFIGEFVGVGEVGAVDDKDDVHVTSQDVATAITIAPQQAIDLHEAASVSTLLAEGAVSKSLWGRRKLTVDLGRSIGANGSSLVTSYQLRNGRGIVSKGCLIVFAPGNVPSRSRITRLAQQAKAVEAVVMVPITARHILAIRFEKCDRAPKEVQRKVYELARCLPFFTSDEEVGQ